MLHHLKQPDISRVSKERIAELLVRQDVQKTVSKCMAPYLFWDKVKYKKWPPDVEPAEGWAIIKFIRSYGSFIRRDSVAKDTNKKRFSWLDLPSFHGILHEIDMQLGGNLQVLSTDLDEKMRNRFIARGVMEEAITSSQLEGANTTRKEAKRMLQEGRKPRNIDERMIMNNYRAMKTIEESLKNERLSEEKLLELHGILTEDTLEDKKEEGAYRRDGKKGKQKIVVEDAVSQEVVFISPPSSFSGKEMMNLIQYANDEQEEAGFIHPVIKAIILHFWLGYLHPFVDGNGRMARAIFYWYLLRHGYWGFSYLSLSKTIKSSPSQYRNAYLYTENDDNDLTYFIEYNLRKILVSLRNFRKYRDRYMSENKKVSAVARQKYGLNDRQIQLLRFLSQKENESATIKMHMNVNDITRATAVKDVHALQKLGFLKSKRIGKEKHYFGTAKLEKIFNQ